MACIVKELVEGRLRATGTGTATRDRFNFNFCHTLPKLSCDSTWLETTLFYDRSMYLFVLPLLPLLPFLLNVVRHRVLVLPLLTSGLLLFSLLFSFGVICL
jgi:hypothetical protein